MSPPESPKENAGAANQIEMTSALPHGFGVRARRPLQGDAEIPVPRSRKPSQRPSEDGARQGAWGRDLRRRYPVFSASPGLVMQEGVEAGFGDVGISGEIGFGREKRPGVSTFPTSVNQVVEGSIHSGRANVRVGFEVVRRIEKE